MFTKDHSPEFRFELLAEKWCEQRVPASLYSFYAIGAYLDVLFPGEQTLR
jgi:hypothetical protein